MRLLRLGGRRLGLVLFCPLGLGLVLVSVRRGLLVVVGRLLGGSVCVSCGVLGKNRSWVCTFVFSIRFLFCRSSLFRKILSVWDGRRLDGWRYYGVLFGEKRFYANLWYGLGGVLGWFAQG